MEVDKKNYNNNNDVFMSLLYLESDKPTLFKLLSDKVAATDASNSTSGSKRKYLEGGEEDNSKRIRTTSSDSVQPLKVLTRAIKLTPTEGIYGIINSTALGKLLFKHPEFQHPNSLTPITLRQKKTPRGWDPNKLTVHLPYSRGVNSDACLFELNPLDPKDPLAVELASHGSYSHIATLGEGSLLDALVYLSNQEQPTLDLNATLSIGINPNSTQLDFYLNISVSILPFFYYSHTTGPKRLFLNHLLPPPSLPEGVPQPEVNVDFFYSYLRRAPRTINGLPIGVEPILVETEEEKGSRLRRDAKGKGKADQNARPAPEKEEVGEEGRWEAKDEGVEDTLLKPKGLKATLMPFQSRTVRWLLAREGKMVQPQENKIVEIEMKGVEGNDGPPSASGSNSDLIDNGGDKMKVDDEDEIIEVEHLENEVDEGEEIILENLPEEVLRINRRGPLWEKVSLQLPLDDEGEIELTQEFWYCRVAGSLQIDDPADEGKIVKEGDEDSDDDVIIVGEEPKMKGKVEEEEYRPEVNVGQGLLSEEMGCGKTVEIISLILLHREPERNLLPAYRDPETDTMVQPTDLTLIITPAAIINQWATELAKHSPGLRVLRYEAVKSIDERWKPLYIAKKYDIILTTFDVLRKEVTIARKPHERNTRTKKEDKHQYRRSLLVQIEFQRCIMDEAQMVSDAVSNISETASLIPRKFSFAVTGTPLKGRIEDLQGLLKFLKVEPVGSYGVVFNHLLEDPTTCIRLFEQIGARTLKSQVQNELFIPQQQRFVVPISFSAVEKYYYDGNYTNALVEMGLEDDGTPNGMDVNAEANWVPNGSIMNRWLVSLRQLCCHPQIGEKNKRVLGKTIKSVEAVLSTMVESSLSDLQNTTRAYWSLKAKRGQLLLWDKEDCEGLEKGLKLFKEAGIALVPIIESLADEFKAIWKIRRAEKIARARSGSVMSTEDDNDDSGGIGATLALGFEDEEKLEDGLPLTEKEKATSGKLSSLRNRIRELLFTQHAACFFSAIAYVNMGKFPKEESQAYAEADKIRQDILTPWERSVTRSAARLKEQMRARDVDKKLKINDLEFPLSTTGHGIIAAYLFDDVDATTDILNGLAELIWQWRSMILQMLYTTVSISDDGDATGEEYAERAELQEQCDIYLEAYATLLGDWRKSLNGERNALGDAAELDTWAFKKNNDYVAAGSKRSRANNAQKKKKLLLFQEAPTLEKGDTHADILRYKLLMERLAVRGDIEALKVAEAKKKAKKAKDRAKLKAKKLKAKKLKAKKLKAKGRVDDDEDEDLESEPEVIGGEDEEDEVLEATPIVQLIKKLRDASDSTTRVEEITLIEMEVSRLKKVLAAKDQVYDRLRGELGDITVAFNIRLKYFAQLQVISDDVADPTWKGWKGFENEFRSRVQTEREMELSITKKASNQRYLAHLKATEFSGDEESVCVICSDSYTNGVVTTCGHVFCSSCFSRWRAKNHSCAICKRELRHGDWQNVKYKKKLASTGERLGGSDKEPQAENQSTANEFDAEVDLNSIDPVMLEEIDNIETLNPLSSKSDLIVKHVKWIRREDPTAKIVIFSAWIESLGILMEAFQRNSIGFVRLESSGKKEKIVSEFINNPEIAAFFLHTKSQSAGLNLVCAQYVFLVEPLLHPSLELQAAGRIHRMGQTKETTVFQYYVTDTVDQRVAELRARQQSSLFLKSSVTSAARDSRLTEQDMGTANTSITAKKTSEEALNDDDEITQCILSPLHFLALQQSLLPPSLRNEKVIKSLRERALEAATLRANIGVPLGAEVPVVPTAPVVPSRVYHSLPPRPPGSGPRTMQAARRA